MDIKRQIIDEYLSSDIILNDLAEKYGHRRQTISRWIVQDQGSFPNRKARIKLLKLQGMKSISGEPLSDDVIELQKQLEQERLRNKLLTAIIDIAEKELKISIRKKSGTKPSSK